MTKPKDLRDPAARARLGGLARKKALTPHQRQAIARQAVLARHEHSTANERREAARKAVLARWAKHRAAAKKKPRPR